MSKAKPVIPARGSPARRAAATALTIACGFLVMLAPSAAQGAVQKIYFRSATTDVTSGVSSITLDAPANTTVGDLLIMDVDTNGGATAFSAPSGWTSIYAGTNYSGGALGGGYTVIAYKVAAAADVGASYVISLGTTRAVGARIADYVGVNTSTPIENTFPTGTNPGGGSGTTLTYPSVTTTVADSVVVLGGVAFRTGTGPTTISTPAGTTSRLNQNESGSSPYITVADFDILKAAAGAVAKTSTVGASSGWGGVSIALDPLTTGALQFAATPTVPSLGTITLNGQAQTTNATMGDFAVDDTTGSASGWNVTVQGNTAAGDSPVFKQYCPNATCGTDTGPGYITGGQTLPAGSLKLNTTGASWSTTGGAGTAPAFQCSSTACSLDASSATKIVSAAAAGGEGPWTTSGFSATSLALSTPTTLRTLTQPGEVYHVDLVWTLGSGP